MNVPISQPCPKCGSSIPESAPQGVCPRCLMQQAMHPTVVIGEPSAAPLESEIIQAFPQFQILQLIGTGGMGRVYKVKQPHLDRVAALKILPKELAADPAFAERFTREGQALAKLSHPNIVGVFDFGQSGDYYWLLMEYVDGVNLRQAMQAAAMEPREALHIIPSICAALEFAHSQGVLHRDIKPENILIDTAGRVKIADFGVAKFSGDPGKRVTLTLSGSALGTPAYMAPEQIERPQDVDHRADIYSLGVVFYEMLTGGLPLGRFPAPSETTGVDPRIDNVVFRTLEKQRERRYQSAGEMKTQVEQVASASQRPAGPPPVPAPPRMAPERTSRKALWGFALVVLGLLGSSSGVVGTAYSARSHTSMRHSQEAAIQVRRARLLHLAEAARRGAITREEFEQRLREYSDNLAWFPNYPSVPAPETAEMFKLRLDEWLKDFENNPRGIPTPPPPTPEP